MADRQEGRRASYARAIFESVSALDDLETETRAASPVGFAEMYRIATDPHYAPSPTFQSALESDDAFRRNFQQLLDKVSLTRLPAVAAASSAPLDHREADGWRVDLRASAADPAQVYVIIERSDSTTETPATIMAETASGSLEKVPLPAPDGGVIQILLEADAAIVTALRDVDAVVYLR